MHPLVSGPPPSAFIRDFDSVEQRLAYASVPGQAAHRLTGMLRTAVLLSGTVLLTDSMLLDGTYFLALGPAGVASVLGVEIDRLPLVVLSRDVSLRAVVESQAAVPTWREGLDGSTAVRHLEETRLDWVHASERGAFPLRPYAGGAFPIEQALESNQELVGALSVSGGVLAERLRIERFRGAAFERIAAAIRDSAIEAAEGEVVRTWWNESYLQAIAAQHGADWLRFDAPAATGGASVSGGTRPRTLVLGGNLVTTMTEIPAAVFSTVEYATRDAAARYRQAKSQRALNALAFAVRVALPSVTSRAEVLRGAAFRLAVAVVAIVLSLPVVSDDLGVAPALLAFAVLVLTVVPWADLLALREAGRRDHEGTITIADVA